METSPAAQAAPGPALDEANLGKLGRFIVSRWFGVFAALLSLLAISVYVFGYTPYLEYLYSDMKAYWDRAMFRLNNNHFSDSQFIAWPPLYHIFLAEFSRVFRWLGLEDWIQLKAALAINISVFAVSVFALQRLAANWFRRPSYVLICVLLYGLGFPALYFNAFLLSGNLGGPLFVIALAVASGRFSWSSLIIAALTFGLATIIRPSLGPYGLAFVLLYACRYGLWNKAFIARAAVFTILFFSVVFAASTEVSRISQGRVNGLSANGGLDFFIANTDYHRVDLTYDGWHFFVVVPSMSWKTEQGIFHTTLAFYKQEN